MKISKKLLSLVLCVAMLLSSTAFASMTSAPQTDAEDLAWFTEPFSATGQSITKRGASTGDISKFYTVGTFNYVLRDGTTDDYVLNLSVSVNDTTQSNYAGVRKEVTSSSYFPLADSIFSISYDICFNEVPASGTILALSGRNIKADGGSVWGISKNLFTGVSDNTKYVGISGTEDKINLNEWYSAKHIFDTKTGYEYITITDSEGNITKITPQAINNYPNAMSNIQGVFMIDISARKACEFCIDNISLKDESVSLETAADAFLATDDVTLTATIPEGFDKAVVMADGNVMGQIAPVAGKNVYDVTIPASELGLGSHELILSASYSDGITRTNATTVMVMKEYETAVSGSITHPTTVQTFDHLFTENMSHSDAIKINGGAKITNTDWQSNCDTYIVPGKNFNVDDEESDYGISIFKNSGLLQIYGLTNPIVNKGKFVVEFDMLLGAASTGIQTENLGTNDAGNFIRDNKIFDSIPVVANEWTHVKLIYDTNDLSLVAVANNEMATTTNTFDVTKGYIRFTLKSNNASFAVDNARIYNLVTDPVINSAAYVTADGETETTGAIPADATAIKLNMSEALDVTSEDVIIWADGEYMQPEDVSSSDGVVTITLPELEANTDLTVELLDTIDGVNSALSHNFYVTDSGSFFKTAGVVTSDNTATAVIRHMGSGTSNAIVAAYKGNQLVSINVCDFKSAADIGAVNVSASTAGADEIKIMAWNTLSSATPKMTAASYPIN